MLLNHKGLYYQFIPANPFLDAYKNLQYFLLSNTICLILVYEKNPIISFSRREVSIEVDENSLLPNASLIIFYLINIR